MPEVSPSLSDRLRRRAAEMLDDMRSLRRRSVLVAVVVVAAIGGFAFSGVGSASQATPSAYGSHPSTSRSSASSAYSASTSVPATQTLVYVVGAVRSPGLYSLKAAARISDAVAAAGGLSDDADATTLNLAAKLTDGQRVYVLRKGEAAPPSAMSDVSSDSPEATVDINIASAKDLEALPGVGPSTAAAIVQYRTQHGAFRSVADLANVKGIGPAKLAQIQSRATV